MTSRNDAGAILPGAETGVSRCAGRRAGRSGGRNRKEQAGQVAGSAKEQAGQVAGTARDQAGAVAGSATDSARRVAGEAATQVRELTDQTRQQLTEQVERQQQQLAGSLRSLAQQLSDMAAGRGGSDGIAGDLVREASQRAGQVAEYLDERNPGELVEELRGLGRRRPAAFLTGAVVSGLLVGRFAKSGAKASQSQTPEGSSETVAADQDAPAPTTPPRSAEPPYLPARATETRSGGLGGSRWGRHGPAGDRDDGRAVRAGSRHRAVPADDAARSGEESRCLSSPSAIGRSSSCRRRTARPAVTEVSVGQLVSEVTSDLSKLDAPRGRTHKAEVKEEASRAGKSAGMLGGAGVAGYFALLFVSLAVMFGLAVVMHTAWAALIVAAVYGVVGVVLYSRGRAGLKTLSPAPTQTVETLKEDVQWAKTRGR